jgi:hypothetical protein
MKQRRLKTIELEAQPHEVKVGQECGHIEPNVTEDSLFVADGKVIGFYLRSMGERANQLAKLCDVELRSKRVPKGTMKRSSGFADHEHEVLQYSTILGAVPPKPHMKRNYATISSVHSSKTAQNFVKGMVLLAKEAEQLIKEIAPEVWKTQMELMAGVKEQWRLTDMYTSSISNYNISANYHMDAANVVGSVNVIITKRNNSKGGNLNLPDYGATVDQCDNSILVYPAWRNIHGVTPIVPTHKGGYRNSLVFYSLKHFLKE